MSHDVDVIIGIRTGGLFPRCPANRADVEKLLARVHKIAEAMEDEHSFGLPEDFGPCTSRELVAPKGMLVVIAGCFNGWIWGSVAVFAARLSAELQTKVLATTLDGQTDVLNCGMFIDGELVTEHVEAVTRWLRTLPPIEL